MIKQKYTKGFTLIELLAVIGIIGLLAAIVLFSLNVAKENAKIAHAKAELKQIQNAMELLASDTGKWPNGCPAGEWENPEVYLDDEWAGLTSIVQYPGAVSMGSGFTHYSCAWTADDLANWKGPYMKNLPLDPWGNHYLFDPDYCDEKSQGVVAILSMGPDGMEEYKTNCGLTNSFVPHGNPPGDDIVLYPGSTLIPLP